jgi:hypothetical protein
VRHAARAPRRRAGDADRAPPDLGPAGARASRRYRAALLALPSGPGPVAALARWCRRAIKRQDAAPWESRMTAAGLARRAPEGARFASTVMGRDISRIDSLRTPLPGACRLQRRRAHRLPRLLVRCCPSGIAGRGRASDGGPTAIGLVMKGVLRTELGDALTRRFCPNEQPYLAHWDRPGRPCRIALVRHPSCARSPFR